MNARAALIALLVALAAATIAATPAGAQRLIASISTHRVMVTPSFTGDELVLFGAIEGGPPRKTGYDVIANVIGPRQNMVTYRRDRVLGIWVNVDSRVFEGAPAYVAVLANRPLEAIAGPETRRRLQVGLEHLPLIQRAAVTIADSGLDDPFRVAFLQLMLKRGLYTEATNGVTFLTPTFFRASIPLPATVPVGSYDVDVRLFADGNQIARTPSAFEVYKAGFEQYVTRAAHNHGFLYGLTTVAMALATGWLASVIFRRD
jgi:uncharacterized protein (TIGR02186 family)